MGDARPRCRRPGGRARRGDGTGRRAQRGCKLRQRRSRPHADDGGRHARVRSRHLRVVQRSIRSSRQPLFSARSAERSSVTRTARSRRRRPSPGPVLIGSYAYVGTTPPTAATTAEFFVYYNCSTRQVVLFVFRPVRNLPADRAAGADRHSRSRRSTAGPRVWRRCCLRCRRSSRCDGAPDLGAAHETPGSAGPFRLTARCDRVRRLAIVARGHRGNAARRLFRRRRGLRRVGGRRGVAGRRIGWLIAGAPAIYVAFYLVVAGLRVRAGMDLSDAAAAGVQDRRARHAAPLLGEAVAMARSHPRMAFEWWAMRDPPAAPARIAGAAAARRAVQRGRVARACCRASRPRATAPSTRCPTDRRSRRSSTSPTSSRRRSTRSARRPARRRSRSSPTAWAGSSRAPICAATAPAQVRCLVTIGTPHHGSVHAWLVPGTLPRADAAGQRVARRAQPRRKRGAAGARRVAVVVARLDGRAADERAPRRRRERRADRRSGTTRCSSDPARARARRRRAAACRTGRRALNAAPPDRRCRTRERPRIERQARYQ